MKQTAVEWLITILERQKDEALSYDEWLIAFEHAKEIEKEQIIDAYLVSHISMMTAEQYYRETYESKTNL